METVKNDNKHREPFIHLTKRVGFPAWFPYAVRAGAILLAFIFASVFVAITSGSSPFSYFGAMLSGIFGSARRVWNLLYDTAILLCVALALTPAFRMHFWNIGGQGQILVGGLACAAVMFYLGPVLPLPILFLLMTVASILTGAVWALIPAIFKAKWNTNETLFTLMMNYVAIQLVLFLTKIWAGNGTTTMRTMDAYGFPDIGGNRYLLRLIVVALLTVGMYIYLKYSKHGYEISVVGGSERTAMYIGINVKKVIVRTLILSGAVCGLAGLLLVGGGSHAINEGTENGLGFTAIMVSWLGKFEPVYMIFTALLITFLDRGGANVASMLGTSEYITDIITGVMLFFIVGSEFFIQYQVHFRHRSKKEEVSA